VTTVLPGSANGHKRSRLAPGEHADKLGCVDGQGWGSFVKSTRSYCGFLDDFALNHRDGPVVETVNELNEQLIAAVLFGDPLLVHDGHLLMNPAVQQAIIHPGKSPLQELVQRGYIKILSRNSGSLGSLAEVMADENITSAERLVSNGWYKTTLKPALEVWTDQVNSTATAPFRSWPNYQTNDVYAELSGQALTGLGAVEPTLAETLSGFKKELGTKLGSRTQWELTADSLLAEKELTDDVRQKLMHAANEAYQYTWGCILSGDDENIRVLTRAPRLLGGLNLSIGPAPSEKRPDLRFRIPDLAFGRKAVRKRWAMLAEMAAEGSPMSIAKYKFLRTLMAYQADGSSVSDKEMRAETKAYTRELSKHFSHPGIGEAAVAIGFLATGVATTLVVPPVGVGLVIVGVGFMSDRLKLPRTLLGWMGAPRKKKWLEDWTRSTPTMRSPGSRSILNRQHRLSRRRERSSPGSSQSQAERPAASSRSSHSTARSTESRRSAHRAAPEGPLSRRRRAQAPKADGLRTAKFRPHASATAPSAPSLPSRGNPVNFERRH
jgi:hypothetical protein